MIETKLIHIDPKNIDTEKLVLAAEILRKGGTVAFPTETVYGLGANALDEGAVKRIFEAKGRPSDNPLIVHISKTDQLNELVKRIPKGVEVLMESFWPGPLTLVLEKSSIVPEIITAGLETVAIRMPAHPIAKALIEMAGVPVAAPSANLSGKPSPTEAKHVLEDLFGRVDMIIDGGDCAVGLESTVLDMTGEYPMILRPGGVTKEQLLEILDVVQTDQAIEEREQVHLTPKSPGMKYTHYAPKAEVLIVEGDLEDVIRTIKKIQREKEKLGLRVGIMATDETKDKYESENILSMGSRHQRETIATNLFKVLRSFDDLGVDFILAEGIPVEGIGHAIMNRLLKAAAYQVIQAQG